MSLRKLNKSQLVEIAEDLSLDPIGTKSNLESKILEHFDNHPELEADPKYSKYIIFNRNKSPNRLTPFDSEGPSSPIANILKPSNHELNSSPVKSNLNVVELEDSDEEKATENVNDDEDDDVEIEVELVERSDAEGEDHDDDDIVESDEEQQPIDNELLDGDEEDAEYIPKQSFFTKFQDCFLEKYERAYDYILDKADDIYYDVSDSSVQLKKKLSTIDTVNNLTTFVELAVLLHNQVPLVELKNATFLDQEISSKYYGELIKPDLKIIDLAALFQVKFIFTLTTWFLLSYALPSIGAYYFNFAAKKHRKTVYDPLSFNLFKLILAYFFLNGNVAVSDVKNDIQVFAAEHGLFDTSIFNHVRAHLFHSSVILRLILDRLPFVNSFIGILIALYVAVIGK